MSERKKEKERERAISAAVMEIKESVCVYVSDDKSTFMV